MKRHTFTNRDTIRSRLLRLHPMTRQFLAENGYTLVSCHCGATRIKRATDEPCSHIEHGVERRAA